MYDLKIDWLDLIASRNAVGLLKNLMVHMGGILGQMDNRAQYRIGPRRCNICIISCYLCLFMSSTN